jgi:hypothetical protein
VKKWLDGEYFFPGSASCGENSKSRNSLKYKTLTRLARSGNIPAKETGKGSLVRGERELRGERRVQSERSSQDGRFAFPEVSGGVGSREKRVGRSEKFARSGSRAFGVESGNTLWHNNFRGGPARAGILQR